MLIYSHYTHSIVGSCLRSLNTAQLSRANRLIEHNYVKELAVQEAIERNVNQIAEIIYELCYNYIL